VLCVALAQREEVLRRDVAVRDTALLECLEPVDDFEDKGEDTPRRCPGERIESVALDELHDHESTSVGTEPVVEERRKRLRASRRKDAHGRQESLPTGLKAYG